MEGTGIRKRKAVSEVLILLFSAAALGSWLVILGWILPAFSETKKIALLAFLLCGLAVGLYVLFHKLEALEKKKIFLIISLCLFLLMNMGLIYAGRELRVYPGWDFGAVYQGAVDIAESGAVSDTWYFTTYPNNVAVCMLLALFFKIFGGLASYITLGVMLNIFLIDVGILCMYMLARRLYGDGAACLAMLLGVLFLPFYMHTPIFYTDTFALPFVSGAFFLFILGRGREDGSWKPGFLIAASVVAGIGFKVKGSLGVLLAAMLIFVWLEKGKMMKKWQQSVLLLVPFLLAVGLLGTIPGIFPVMDMTDAENNEFPLEHWLAMGLEGNGGYNQAVYMMTASVEGKEEKQAVDRAFIREKLEEYGTAGMLEHLKEKVTFTWGDGVYFAPEKLKRDPLKESRLHTWFLYDGMHYNQVYRYCSAFHLMLMLGIVLSLVRNLMRKGEIRESLLIQLSVFGLFLFLLFWETRSRYLVNFVPMFILLGVDGMQIYTDVLNKWGRRK